KAPSLDNNNGTSAERCEWTDATWNSLRGCTKISPGCAHCYAETLAERFRGVPGNAYEQGFDLRLVPEKLAEPPRWSDGGDPGRNARPGKAGHSTVNDRDRQNGRDGERREQSRRRHHNPGE